MISELNKPPQGPHPTAVQPRPGGSLPRTLGMILFAIGTFDEAKISRLPEITSLKSQSMAEIKYLAQNLQNQELHLSNAMDNGSAPD